MISLLRGRIVHKSLGKVIIDVSGVGYGVTVPLSTYHRLPSLDSEAALRIHTSMKDSSIELFGFLTEEEQEVFSLLLGVSGVGPKLAISILSNISPGDLSEAVSTGDLARRKIPGIGPRLASRLVTELKDKLPEYETSENGDAEKSISASVVSALVNLGYKKPEIDEHISELESIAEKAADMESALRESLRLMKKV